MRLDKVSLADTHSFSSFFIDYIEQKENLKPYFGHFPTPGNFEVQLRNKSAFSQKNRDILRDSLLKQYEGITLSDSVEKNIHSLSDKKTFTVVTGHQLNIFTGPFYFIFKIITVINTCKRLKREYPDYNFVPVYWMASEDHDYDEIKYFRLYGKKYVWTTEQQGAVGRFHTNGLTDLAKDIPGQPNLFVEAYSKQKTLASAVRHYVNALFGTKGLVVIDADDRKLKSQFTDVMVRDILHHDSKGLVDKTNRELEGFGYKTQIYCRDINFFFLNDGLRARIEKKDDQFHVVDTDIKFSQQQIEKLISEEPEKFSPNVILRPLYQEMILPNVAYVGGPAEVIYWLQLKAVFDHFSVPFPILMPRNFGMVINHELSRKFEKTGLDLKDLFEEKNYLFNHWILKHSTHTLTVGSERNDIASMFDSLRKRAESIDPTLGPFVGAEGKRAMNSLEKIERKMLRAEKRLHTDKLKQIESVKDALFPNGSLQERTDNFLNFYQRDPALLDQLEEAFDPFDFKFNLLTYTS